MEKFKRALSISLLLWAVLYMPAHVQPSLTPLAPCSLADIDRDDDGLIEICDLESLNAIRYQLDGSGYRSSSEATKITAGCSVREGCKGYELVRDLDFNDSDSYQQLINKNIWTTDEGWQPIGNALDPFSAIFKGNGYAISNLYIHREIDNVGLFSRTREAAEINGLRLLNVGIKGNFWVGSLIGFSKGKIARCSIVGGDLIAEGDVGGGLVGINKGVISNSHAHINLTGGSKAGGLVGDNRGLIINSYVGGSVRGVDDDVGGLVGHNSGEISNSYARSYVKGTTDNVGGLIGLNSGIVTNSYVASNMQAGYDVQGRYRVGGLVGDNKHSIVNSYATASVIGDGYIGGLVGFNRLESETSEIAIVNSHWDLTTSRVRYSAGGTFGTSEQLKFPIMPSSVIGQFYYRWSTGDWDFGTEQHYPALKYTIGSDAQHPACGLSSELLNCGDLLAGQYTALSDLVILGGLELLPPFKPDVFSYRVAVGDETKQLKLIPTSIRPDTEISIIGDGGFSRRVASGTLTTIPLDVSAYGTPITIARQYKIDLIYPLRIKGIPLDNRVREGAHIRLEASRPPDWHARSLFYDWTQLSGIPLLSEVATQQPVLEIEVPKNLIARDADSSDVVLRLQVSDGTLIDSREVTLAITKAENGSSPKQLAAPTFVAERLTLIAPEISETDLSSDPDGIETVDVLSYRWQSKSASVNAIWHDIKHATAPEYEIPLNLNIPERTRYRLQVNYTDGQGYKNNSVVSVAFVLPLLDIDRDDDGLIEINYLEDLAAMRNRLDGRGVYTEVNGTPVFSTKGCPAAECIGYELTRDLDFNNDDSYRDPDSKSLWAQHGGWKLISGNEGNSPFTAVFNGNHKTISNFRMHDSEGTFTSLFGHTRGKIMNLGLLDVDVAGWELVGSLSGLNEGTIANCYANGSIASVGGDDLLSSAIVGGLVGNNRSEGMIINSYASINIKGKANHIGGLVGNNQAAIINSYASARVTEGNTAIGGLVGLNEAEGTILNGYARGSVAGKTQVGGLVGYSKGYIANSYAVVKVSGDTSIGGLVGDAVSSAQVANSYWDSRISEVADSMGGTSKTSVELRSATAGQNRTPTEVYYKWSNDDWDFGTREEYPILKYGIGADNNNRACRRARDTVGELPICGTPLPDRQRGLGNLLLLGKGNISISPNFSGSVANYEITVASLDNLLRLIPVAVDPDAVINIGTNERVIDEGIKSGITSSPISLDSDNIIRITITVKGKTIDYYNFHVRYIPYTDLDEDNDGLIEIRKLEDLNAIRYQLDGSGYRANPNVVATTIGCPETGCKGYELIRDLDFNDDASYRRIENKDIWTKGEGWLPIGNGIDRFKAIFRGNMKNIYHLTVNRLQLDDAGLFGVLGNEAEIDGVGLLNMDVRGKLRVGGLVGANLHATISNSYVDGTVEGQGGLNSAIGGLVGLNSGSLSNSYAVSNVIAKDSEIIAGGLVGWNLNRAMISDSYALSKVGGAYDVGGLVGSNFRATIVRSYAVAIALSKGSNTKGLVGTTDNGSVSASYWDTTIAQTMGNKGTGLTASGAIGLTSEELRSPIVAGSSATQVYFGWSDKDWDFGTSEQYPSLRYNHPRCNNLPQPPCGSVFPNQNDIRLRSLSLSEGSGLVPTFEPLIFTYDVFVSAEINLIRLTPTAFNSVFISIGKDGRQAAELISGTTSEPIPLNENNPTLITIAVEGKTPFEYRLNVYRLAAVVDDIDEDDDGLIEINNLEELNEIRYQTDGSSHRISATAPKITIGCPPNGCRGYELSRDLDFKDTLSYRNANYRDAQNMDKWTSKQGWMPIENFKGIFKGNGYTISNLTINRPNADKVGLFADTDAEAIIEGIGLLNIDISGADHVGGLVGMLKGRVADSYATGKLAVQHSRVGGIGGLVGNSAGEVTDSHATVDIEVTADANKTDSSVGALVGESSGVISISYALGDVLANGVGVSMVGGLVGKNKGAIFNSYARGNVSGENRVGGLVGHNNGLINNNYATGRVVATTEGGGLVGRNVGLVVNSYTISEVAGGSDNGGLVGKNVGISVGRSYWNAETGKQKYSEGGTSATTIQLKSPVSPTEIAGRIYFKWNTADWDFGTSEQYPVLKYRDVTCDTPQESPKCGTILSGQRFGLVRLELSQGARLLPSFQPEILNYDIAIDADRSEFSLTPIAVNRDDRITIRVGGEIESRIASGAQSRTIAAHNSRVVLGVNDKHDTTTLYKIKVHRLSFVVSDIDEDDDGLIEINDLEGLNAIRYRPDGTGYRESMNVPVITEGCPADGCRGYELIADLDFNDNASYRRIENKDDLGGEAWKPIASIQNPFIGIFEGNGRIISNLIISRTDEDGVGLFGYVGKDGRIANVGLLNARLVGRDNVGALVGASKGMVVNSYAVGSVKGQGHKTGGLVGENLSSGVIINSYARVHVDASNKVGGFVGFNKGRIDNCYATGNVVASGSDVGGFVGENFAGKINNSYATGNVKGFTNIGGFVGSHATDKGRVTNSYAIGRVLGGGTSSGGFGGINGGGTFLNNYWDIQTSGIKTSVRGSRGFNTEIMQSPPTHSVYVDWSTNIWDFGMNELYPSLKYIKGVNVVSSFRNNPACGNRAGLPKCNDLLPDQHVGLVNLELGTKGFNLSPSFERFVFHYRLTVFSDTEHIRLIPSAYDNRSEIRVIGIKDLDERVVSATTGSVISLNITDATTIKIEVRTKNNSTVQYVIDINRLDFTADEGRIDKDGDGLIDINYLEDLHAIRYQLDGSGYRADPASSKITAGCPPRGCLGYELVGDLDFANDSSYRRLKNKNIWNSNRGWLPIGSESHPFASLFNGNNKVISNLKINRPDAAGVGLFGALSAEGRIDDVGLSDIEIVASHRVGGIVGINGGTLVNSYASGSVEGKAYRVGGLVGKNMPTATIVNSYAGVHVSANDDVGGLVGFNEGHIGSCYASGSVRSRTYNAGGLVGNNYGGTIKNNYAVGDVIGIDNVGGFIGNHTTHKGEVAYNYAIGKVLGSGQNIGGLVGADNGGKFFYNYWDTQSSGVTASVGGFGFNSEDLQSLPTSTVYVNWSAAIWYFEENSYPLLKYAAGIDAKDLVGNPACGHSQYARCGSLIPAQRIGLINLQLAAKEFTLLPNFNSSISNYRVTVFKDTESIRLIPTAHGPASNIRITDGSGFDEFTVSATTSSAIPLNTTATALITISVQTQNDKAVQYTININRLNFVLNDNRVDGDGDGFIDINYLEDLYAIRYQLDGSGYRVGSTASKITAGCPNRGCKGYELSRDLDFADDASYRRPENKYAWTRGDGWLPLGSEIYPFVALFNGNLKTLSNLKIYRPDADDVGLFGVIGRNGRVSGVGLSDIKVVGNKKVGGLAGVNIGIISHSRTDGIIEGTGDRVGGLVGENDAIIVNSYANAEAIGTHYIGGLVGLNKGDISGCYAGGNVVGKHYGIGGFVGINFSGTANNNYAMGDAGGTDHIGGFVGINRARGELANNYAIGKVFGSGANVGGFIGTNSGLPLHENYWNIQTSGITAKTSGSKGLNTGQMKSLPTKDIYVGWDTKVWHFEEDSYPLLKYLSSTAVPNLPLRETACEVERRLVCGILISGQRIGLADLRPASGILTMSPNFDGRVLRYRVTVYADVPSIQFIPTAYRKSSVHDKDSVIRIIKGRNFDEVVASATTSSAIPLHATDETAIIIEAQTEEDRTVRYLIKVEHLNFLNVGDKVDRDGNGFIEINYLEDLHAIRYQLDGSGYRANSGGSKITVGCPLHRCIGYELNRDLNFSESDSYRDATANMSTWIKGVGWLPIGIGGQPFSGIFHGNDYTIYGLTINRPEAEDVGLFSVISSEARIENVRLSGIDVGGKYRVGGLVGTNYGVVRSSRASGRVGGEMRSNNSTLIGGLVGYNANQIINSFAVGEMIGNSVVGGLVGANDGGQIGGRGLIVNSYAVSTVKGNTLVGGLAGRNQRNAQIVNSYADGKVLSNSRIVGGLVGSNTSKIANAYAAGSVSGSRTVGGLAGSNKGNIVHSYATASVRGNIGLGGLVGSGESDLVRYSYWDTNSSGMEYSGGGIGFATAVLQLPIAPSDNPSLPYYQWSTTDWHFGSISEYPVLRYTSGSGALGCGDTAELPRCEAPLLPYGLTALEILERTELSPPFKFSHLSYRIAVNRGTPYIRLVPTASNPDAIIVIKVNNRIHAHIRSGERSPKILLNQNAATIIAVEIDDIAYSLAADYLPVMDAVKDIDDDDDGLIEINYLEDLHAIRNQAARMASRADGITNGCAVGGCIGYELVRDLDFNREESYRNPIINKPAWTAQRGWVPIGILDSKPFNSLLKGNGYSISNLRVNHQGFANIGLFGIIGSAAEIDSVGLLNCSVNGFSYVGGLGGWNKGGTITNSYVIGSVSGNEYVGGLIGRNEGAISNSYASGQVLGRDNYAGGLVGDNHGSILNSYTKSRMVGSGTGIGGLVGLNINSIINSYAVVSARSDDNVLLSGLVAQSPFGRITNSYWDITTSGIESGTYGIGLSSDELKFPVVAGTTASEVYYGWHRRDWDFGSNEQYPALKYTYDRSTLLPHQRDGLYSLTISEPALMFPPFNVHIHDYHLVVSAATEQIRLQAVAIDATARVGIRSGDSSTERLTSATATVLLNETSATHITITVKAADNRRVRYRFSVDHLSPIEIGGIPRRSIDEGQFVKLDGRHRLDKGTFSYSWTQVSGVPLLSEVETDRAILDFIVPTDLVSRAIDSSAAVLRLEIGADTAVISKVLSITINKRNNGIIPDRFVAPILHDAELTVAVKLSLDPDGGGDADTVVYRWQSLVPDKNAEWRDINGATKRRYEIPWSVRDATRYRVLISYADNQGYIHQDIASEVFTAVDIDKDDDGLIELSTPSELNAVRYMPDGSGYKPDITENTDTVGCPPDGCIGYELVNDLSLSGLSWHPIGTDIEPFSSVFKGNNHTISNLHIDRTDRNAVGLFGIVSSTAHIDGVGLINADVKGYADVGGLAGVNYGTITDSYISKSKISGSQGNIGGLVGANYGIGNYVGVIANSYADVDLIAHPIRNNIVDTGGLAGLNNEGLISNSYAKGNVSGGCGVGGLVAQNIGASAVISNCYAVAEVSVNSDIEKCRIYGFGFADRLRFAGGLVGYNDIATVENSYAIGRVLGESGDSLVGLVGINYGSIDTIKNSYWDATHSGIKTGNGGTSKTTVELQSPTVAGSTPTEVYYGWSGDDWDFGSSEQYPMLKYGRTMQACDDTKASNCGLLLPNQSRSSGLTQLILLGEATLIPAFHPKTFSYRIAATDGDAVELIVLAENLNVKSEIAVNGKLVTEASSGERILIPLSAATATTITIELTELNQRPTRYELHLNRNPEIVIRGIPDSNVLSEGMRVRLDASASHDADADHLNYRWMQLSGVSLLSDPTKRTDAILDFAIPEDLIAETDIVGEAVLRLTVSDGASSVFEDIPMRIKKINNGSISIKTPEFIGAFEVSAPELELAEDPDGVGDANRISYQWQVKNGFGWLDIADGTDKSYRLGSTATTAALYRVRLSYIDGQGYKDTLFSKAVGFSADLDRDDDGLIEVGDLEGLNAMRYVLNGIGYKESSEARVSTVGCPMSRCRGYELIRDLDFKDDASYRYPTANKQKWSEDEGWQPIGGFANRFTAIFEGNGYTVSNLKINTVAEDVGFFGVISEIAEIDNIGLSVNVNASAGENVGGLVGTNDGGTIRNSYVIADVIGGNLVGALVGFNSGGTISNSYARGKVTDGIYAGGLVGYDFEGTISNVYTHVDVRGDRNAGGLIGAGSNSTVINSYATAKVSSHNDSGGLIGSVGELRQTTIINSYWNTDNNKMPDNLYGTGMTRVQLQRAISPGTTSTEAYYNWRTADWDFGNEAQYPILKDANGNLLPNQRVGLIALELVHPAELSPRFDTTIFDYDVTVVAATERIRLLAAAVDADIRINGYAAQSGRLSPPIYLLAATTTVITLSVIAKGTAPVQYTLNVNNHFPQVAVAVIPQSEVSEGDDVALDVTAADPNGDKLIYRWSQDSVLKIWRDTTIPEGVIGEQSDADLSFKIPTNLLPATRDDGMVILNLIITDGTASIAKDISIHISKKNNGAIRNPPPPTRQDLSYIVPRLNALMAEEPDGGAHPNTVQYQWQKYEGTEWVDISGEIGASYTPHQAEIDQPYRVRVRYTDNQGHQDSAVSEETTFTLSEISLFNIFVYIKILLEGLLKAVK